MNQVEKKKSLFKKTKSLTKLISVCAMLSGAMISQSSLASAIGCDGLNSDANKLYVYDGPTFQGEAAVIGSQQTFKSKNNEENITSTAKWKVLRNTGSGWTLEHSQNVIEKRGKSELKFTPTERGYYVSSVKSIYGGQWLCNNRAWKVQAKPTASAQTSLNGNNNTTAGTTIYFYGGGTIDQYAKNSYLTYSWDFGDGTTSTLENPNHSYTAQGTYHVTLTTFDGKYYSQDTVVATISVTGPPRIVPFIEYEYLNCVGGANRKGLFSWTASEGATSYQLQEKIGSYWSTKYTGASNNILLTLSATGSKTMRIKATNSHGSSGWKQQGIYVPSCSGGGLPLN